MEKDGSGGEEVLRRLRQSVQRHKDAISSGSARPVSANARYADGHAIGFNDVEVNGRARQSWLDHGERCDAAESNAPTESHGPLERH